MSDFRLGICGLTLAVTLCCGAQPALASTLEEIMQVGQARTDSARASQRVIDEMAEETQARFRDYRQKLKEIEGLRVYNERLVRQIANQRKRIKDIEEATRNAVIVQRQIPALTENMIDALEHFVRADVPFHGKERRERLNLLRANQDRSNVSIAEKFRQVLEAYKIENEYGRKVDTYRDSVEIDGVEREVSMLRIGRLALIYQTTDGDKTGIWNQSEKRWLELSRGAYKSAVLKGMRIARKQAAIEVMKVPVFAPQAL